MFSYFGAVCSIFEPERAKERLAWTKTAALVHTIASHYKDANAHQRRAFLQQFTNFHAAQPYDNNAWYVSFFLFFFYVANFVASFVCICVNIFVDACVSINILVQPSWGFCFMLRHEMGVHWKQRINIIYPKHFYICPHRFEITKNQTKERAFIISTNPL